MRAAPRAVGPQFTCFTSTKVQTQTHLVDERVHLLRRVNLAFAKELAYIRIRQHTPAYVNIRQHTSAGVSTLLSRKSWHTSAYVSIRQHIREHTSAYVSRRVNLAFAKELRHVSASVFVLLY